MPKLLLHYSDFQKDFLPLTLTRPFIDLRTGILTVAEKWKRLALSQQIDIDIISDDESASADMIWDASMVPMNALDIRSFIDQKTAPTHLFFALKSPWDIIRHNTAMILEDMELLKHQFEPDLSSSQVLKSGEYPLYVHPTAELEHCFVNTNEGPVMIDADAFIMQGTMLRGPLYIGKRTVVKMGATLYAGTNVGNDCIVGGEIKNAIFHAYSNKGHHGYLGDSYVGEWCNMGAGTSCSNLKNTAGELKAWNMDSSSYINAGKKAGILMGDHVKTAINTSFNSGTVIGGFSNVHNLETILPKYIAPFQWGMGQKYDLDKLLEEVTRWMSMKGQKPTTAALESIKTYYLKTIQQ
jgi:UDP-N-acetylglucosamine diphosphorylase/glucosamine-1-phosphate N-acetyltransferase